MQLSSARKRKAFGCVRRRRKNGYGALMLTVSVSVGLAAVTLFAGVFPNRDTGTVYAVKSSTGAGADAADDGEDGGRLQAGLMGIVSSVDSMKEYTSAAENADLTSGYGEILVGSSSASKRALNQLKVEKGTAAIGEIGYYARLTVQENQMDTEDYDALLRIVEAEATGGDSISKILIANVVLNRVKDSRFADTIYDVVWERTGGVAQFSPTADGRINSVTITEETIEAVDRALAGEDYSQGALCFMARESADNSNVKWFDENLVLLFEYGGHEFFTFADGST